MQTVENSTQNNEGLTRKEFLQIEENVNEASFKVGNVKTILEMFMAEYAIDGCRDKKSQFREADQIKLENLFSMLVGELGEAVEILNASC